MNKSLRTLVLLAALSASSALGQIVSFSNDNPDTNNWTPSSGQFPLNFLGTSPTGIVLSANTNLSIASLSVGAGATVGTATDSLGFNSAGDASTLTEAISGNEYFSFSMSAKPGFVINVTGLKFSAEASSPTSTFVFNVLGSKDAFTAANSLGSFTVVNGAQNFPTIDISANSKYQSIGGTVEFRIYVYRTAGTGTAAYFADDIGTGNLFAINGTVTAIPEPSSATVLLGSLALTGVVGLRRRRRF